MIEWTHWHNEPLLIGALVLFAWIYASALGPWRHRLAPREPFPRNQALRFAAGVFVFYLAVGSPLDQIGERFLFSAHMAQHMLIVYVAAPLVLAGIPAWLIDLPLAARPVRAMARVVFAAPCAAVLYVLCVSIWHVPAFYDLALRDKTVHVVQHLMFFGVALCFWWPLASPSRLVPARPPAVQILYVFGAGVLQFPLVAFLTFSKEVLYPTYEFAPRLTSLSARDDQVLGGALMGVGGMFIALGLMTHSFYLWTRQEERFHDAAARSTLRT